MPDLLLGENLNRSRRIFDKALELRNGSTAQITATTSETGIPFDCRKLLEYVCMINISTIDRTTGDESYVFTLEVCATLGGTYVAISTLTLPTTAATVLPPLEYIMPASGATAQAVLATSAFIRITATLGGTTPILKYSASLAPSSN